MQPEPRWIVRQPESGALAKVREAEASADLPPLVQRLLCLRGLDDPAEIARFLFPKLQDLTDPFLLPEMDRAVERLLAAADQAEKVVIYGDYDVDGVTSLTLLKGVLGAIGIDATTFLPHRTEEGYGISSEGLARCLAERRPDLLVAVDCGTSSAEEIARLSGEGIDVIVIDHHECPPGNRPRCVALVNPKASADGSPTGFEYLCSAGLVFKVAHALLKRRRPSGDFDLRAFLDIAALGTVADIVPLIAENRLIVRRGLQQLERTGHPGLRELKRVASVNGRVAASDVGFRLGPRLNAAGRVDTAQAALDLLLTQCDQEARRLAEQLDEQNRERQTIERRTLQEAETMLAEQFDPRRDVAIVLGSEAWHPGVVGIVASRLMRAFHRPTFIVAFDESGVGKGSGRSIEGISLIEAIEGCRDCLINGGGHEMAAGITVERARFDTFRERFDAHVRAAAERGEDVLVPRLDIDAVTELHELDLDMLDAYELIQPFGNANPEPVFMARGIHPAEEPRVLKDRHLRLRLRQNGDVRPAIFFGGAAKPLPRPPWDVAFRLQRNHYRGVDSLQLVVQAVRPAREGE